MYISFPLFCTTSSWNFQKLPLFMEEMLNVFFVFIIFSLLLIFTLVAARIILTAAIKCQCFSLLSESMWTLKLSRKKESASLLFFFFLFLGVRRFTSETGGCLKCKIPPWLTWRGIRTYWRVRTIFLEPKFMGCIDNQIFLPIVLRCEARVRAPL